jgi:hypothetical protein
MTALDELIGSAQHITLHATEWKVLKDNKSELHDLIERLHLKIESAFHEKS